MACRQMGYYSGWDEMCNTMLVACSMIVSDSLLLTIRGCWEQADGQSWLM